jgi:SAM-dependent methyltransferase
MEPAYRGVYRDLYERHWWWRARAEWIIDTLTRFRPAQGWTPILDIGCGEGLFFDRLSIFGDVEGIEVEEGLPPIEDPRREKIHAVPFDETFRPEKAYALILMLDVLEHLPDPVTALQHVRRLLAPGGVFMATVPAFQLLWTNHDAINHHFRRYSVKELRALLKNTDMQVLEERYAFQWLAPVKLALRGLERLAGVGSNMPKVPPAWINEPLYIASRLEQKLLGRLPIPFGSSLMVIAQVGG